MGIDLVDDLALDAAPLAHASRSHDRAQGACDASLPPDHLADIILCDMQAKHHGVFLVDTLDAHGVRIVDELLRQVLEQLRHLLSEVLRLEQLLNRLRGQRALAEPVLHLLLVELDQGRIALWVVAPHDLDELAVARRARIGHDDAIDGILLRPDARQPHAYGQTITSCSSVVSSSCWILSLFAGPAAERRAAPVPPARRGRASCPCSCPSSTSPSVCGPPSGDSPRRAPHRSRARFAGDESRRSPAAWNAPAASSRGSWPRPARTASRRSGRCPRAAFRARESASAGSGSSPSCR